MKPLLIILILVAVLQAATLGYGLVSDGDADRPSDEAVENGEWEPSYAAIDFLDSVAAPFRSSPTVSTTRLTLQEDQSRTISYSDGEDGQAINFEAKSGYGVHVRYNCSARDDRDTCPQTMCLCALNARIDPGDFSRCGKVRPQAVSCPLKRTKGRIIIYNASGDIRIEALGDGETDLNIN